MAATSPEASRPDRGGRPLDPERPAPDTSRPADEPTPADGGSAAAGAERDGAAASGGAAPGTGPGGGPASSKAKGSRGEPPPGLFAQLKTTKDAALGLLRAHIALGKAEAEEIKGEVAYLSAFLGIALAALLLLAIFLPIVGMLFVGEALFGSIGWGVLLGSELLLVIAATAVVVGLKLEGPKLAAVAAVVAWIVTLVILGGSWFNRLWTWIGDAAGVTVDPAVRPLLVAIAAVGVVGAVVGLIVGARATGFGGAVVGLFGGAVLGGFVGAFLAYDFGWRVGAALAFAAAYAVYLGVLASRVAASGIDTEKIKARFWPQQSIDTAKESIEWAKAQNPLAPKS